MNFDCHNNVPESIIIVENYADYRAARKQLLEKRVVWHTTSPYLLENLPKEGEKIYSLEQELDPSIVNNIAKASYEIAEEFLKNLNKDNASWLGYADCNFIWGRSLAQFFFITFYKGFLLQLLVNKYGRSESNEIICVGDTHSINTGKGLNFVYGRFDTIFALIASKCQIPRFQILQNRIDDDLFKGTKENFKVSNYERILKIINNTPSSFFYKVLKKYKGNTLLPLKSVCLWPFFKKKFYILNDNDLVNEVFFSLLFRGSKIGWLDENILQFNNNLKCSNNSSLDFEEMQTQFHKIVTDKFANFKVNFFPIFKSCEEIVVGQFIYAFKILHGNIDKITRRFKKIEGRFNNSTRILTTGLAQPIERLFFCYSLDKEWDIAAFEHGITTGLSDFTIWHSKNVSVGAGSIGVYHNEISAQVCEKNITKINQKQIIAHLSKVTREVLYKGFQKRLSRKWLGLSKSDHVVMYVAELEHNNFKYGPYAENDWQFLSKTKSIISYLAECYPNSKVVLKLYPTQRYRDCYDFKEFESLYDNILVIDYDFRFVRSAADLIFVSSSQSTLGWVMGAGVPYVYLQSKWARCRLGGLRINSQIISGIDEFIIVDEKKLVNKKQINLAKQLLDI